MFVCRAHSNLRPVLSPLESREAIDNTVLSIIDDNRTALMKNQTGGSEEPSRPAEGTARTMSDTTTMARYEQFCSITHILFLFVPKGHGRAWREQQYASRLLKGEQIFVV